jgi:membrane protease subunit (stomatin/prohibitin family)
MNIVGDLRAYTQYQAAQSIPIAAANPGGIAGIGVGLGAGMGMGGAIADAMRGAMGGAPAGSAPAAGASAADGRDQVLPALRQVHSGTAKFCPECGGAQE